MPLESGIEPSAEHIEMLEVAVERKDAAWIVEEIGDLHPADITQLLYDFDSPACKYIISLLPYDVGAEILTNLDSETRKKFLRVTTTLKER